MTEAALVDRVASGDRDALAVLFNRHHQDVFALCCRLCGSEADAEDVTQEVFLRVLRHAATFSSRARFSTWLYQITRNACLSYRRGDTREHTKRTRYATAVTVDDPSETSAPESTARLRAALEGLEPQKREVLILKRYHGLSVAEIVEVCGCSTGAVRVRLHRALQALREQYFNLERSDASAMPGDR